MTQNKDFPTATGPFHSGNGPWVIAFTSPHCLA